MITKKQKHTLDFIKYYQSHNGYAPSLDEIRKKFGWASVSTAHFHVCGLRNRGYLTKEENKPRAIDPVIGGPMVRIPLLGTIAAGSPLSLFESVNETIAVPQSKTPVLGRVYALRVVGDSMIEENIQDGDIILVQQQATAGDGQKIVALLDNDSATLKKYYRERGHVRLQPANSKMEALIIRKDRDFSIQGIVLDVIKGSGTFLADRTPREVLSLAPHDSDTKSTRSKFSGNGYEFYQGDCLELLRNIGRKYSVIYLDPPFNTNRNYKYQQSDKTHVFEDKWAQGEYERWVEKLIILCKACMIRTGSLFFHISAELSFVPEKILRRHFKKVEPIFWKKAHGKNTVKNKLGAVVDVIFKASENGSKFNIQYVPLDEYYFEHSYRNKDEVGYYALGSIKHDKSRRGHFYTIKKDGIIYETPYGWKIPKTKLEDLLKEGRIHFARPKPGTNRGMLYKKLYKHEVKGKPLSNLWDDIAYITRTTKDQRLYPTQKPVELLKRIIQLSSNKGDWILDPVAGSGTTGVAALSLNRCVTLLDSNSEAAEIISKRLHAISPRPSGS